MVRFGILSNQVFDELYEIMMIFINDTNRRGPRLNLSQTHLKRVNEYLINKFVGDEENKNLIIDKK